VPVVRPFTALVYDTTVAGPLQSLTAPPYDTISEIDQDRYYAASAFNVVRLILGKVAEGDDRTGNKYTRAGSLLRAWRDERIRSWSPRRSRACIHTSSRSGLEEPPVRSAG